MKRFLMIMCVSVLLWGCNDVFTNEYPYGEEFSFDYGKYALVGGESLIQFLGIKGDSPSPN